MSKPWAIGAWAAEAEREEAEEKERAAAAAVSDAPAASGPSMEAFPTLGESLAVKSKKKKPQTFSLAELTVGMPVGPGSRLRSMSDVRGLTPDEMMMLPTGPRDRSSEDEGRGGLGGAFRDYRDYNRSERELGRPGYGGGGGFERDREGSGFLRDRERDEPSRADDSSDWSSSKKSVYPGDYDGERRREPRFSDRDRDSVLSSRADDADNWGFAKKSLHADARLGGRREPLEHSRAEEVDNWASVKKPLPPRPVGHDAANLQSRADGADNWASIKKTVSAHVVGVQDHADGRWGRRTDLGAVKEEQRKPLVIAPRSRQASPPRQVGSGADSVGISEPLMNKSKLNPFGSARPREDVLSDRVADLPRPKDGSTLRDQDSRPSSSHSSRHDSLDSTQGPLVQARPKVNPFGSAKPREVLLQERGKDWQKMDFEYEHRGVDRPETEEELSLKEEIKRLTEFCKNDKESGGQQMNGVVGSHDEGSLNAVQDLQIKEKQLQDLIRALDDKVRFSQKIGDRPGSRSGRSDTSRTYESSERPGGSRPGSRAGSRPVSRSGRSDASRNYDHSERPGSQSGRRNFDSSESPRSRSGYGGRIVDTGDRWTRPAQFEGSRNQEGLDRKSSWAGSSDSGRSFDSLQRTRRYPFTLPTEVGGAPDYSQQGGGPDIWT